MRLKGLTIKMNSAQLPDSRIWFVHSGHGDKLASYFLDNGIVVMGWDIGPVGPDDSKDEILRRVTTRHPGEKPGTLDAWASQIKSFNQEMQIGDAVATREPPGGMCHIGIIRSLRVRIKLYPNPYFENGDHVHEVEWLYEIPLNILSKYTRRRLGNPRTLHRLSPEASAELKKRCSE